MVDFCHFLRMWRGASKTQDTWTLEAEMNALVATHLEDYMTPTKNMWKAYLGDYTPLNKSSHITCTPPTDNKPPLAILAAISTHS